MEFKVGDIIRLLDIDLYPDQEETVDHFIFKIDEVTDIKYQDGCVEPMLHVEIICTLPSPIEGRKVIFRTAGKMMTLYHDDFKHFFSVEDNMGSVLYLKE